MANMAKIEDKLAILPALPGCYLMKNKEGDIIYVGKAKKLKNRVRQRMILRRLVLFLILTILNILYAAVKKKHFCWKLI